jgi:hypothetical protein
MLMQGAGASISPPEKAAKRNAFSVFPTIQPNKIFPQKASFF